MVDKTGNILEFRRKEDPKDRIWECGTCLGHLFFLLESGMVECSQCETLSEGLRIIDVTPIS